MAQAFAAGCRRQRPARIPLTVSAGDLVQWAVAAKRPLLIRGGGRESAEKHLDVAGGADE